MTHTDLAVALQASGPNLLGEPLSAVTPKTVWKSCLPQEVDIMQRILRHTSIPVPNVNRTYALTGNDRYQSTYLERITGTTLAELWPTMSWWRRLVTVANLRHYIRQLRNVPPQMPCSPAGIFWESPHAPPTFQSGFDMQEYFLRHIIAHDMEPPAKDPGGWNDLVLSHMDLNPSNVMIDDGGHVWLIDFGFSGYYPRWMEAVNMHILTGSARQDSDDPELRSYYELTFLICGWHWDAILWWEKYSYAWFRCQPPFDDAPDSQ